MLCNNTTVSRWIRTRKRLHQGHCQGSTTFADMVKRYGSPNILNQERYADHRPFGRKCTNKGARQMLGAAQPTLGLLDAKNKMEPSECCCGKDRYCFGKHQADMFIHLWERSTSPPIADVQKKRRVVSLPRFGADRNKRTQHTALHSASDVISKYLQTYYVPLQALPLNSALSRGFL